MEIVPNVVDNSSNDLHGAELKGSPDNIIAHPSAPQGATHAHQEDQNATSTHGAPQGALHAHQLARSQEAAREANCSVLGLHHVIHPCPSLGPQEISPTDMARESRTRLRPHVLGDEVLGA
ncbi:hypothetical protein GQ457_16G017760 [Hibiscus cannabinus]